MQTLSGILDAYFCSAQHGRCSFSLTQQPLKRSDSVKKKGRFKISAYPGFHTSDKLAEAEKADLQAQAGANRIA